MPTVSKVELKHASPRVVDCLGASLCVAPSKSWNWQVSLCEVWLSRQRYSQDALLNTSPAPVLRAISSLRRRLLQGEPLPYRF